MNDLAAFDPLTLEMNDDQLAMHQIDLDRCRQAYEISLRCDAGTTTKEDGDWIRAEYGVAR